LTAVLTNFTDPVIVVDHTGVIALANQAANQALGLPADVVGQRAEDVIHAEPIAGLLHTNKPDTDKPIEWQNDDGQTYTLRIAEFESSISPQRGRVLILRDITRFKQLHANHTDFVDTVLHDLRSPLTYMQGYANMLPMVGELTPKQKDFADRITTGITQMTDLVEKSLDAGRLDPETGYYELSRELCDLAKVASDVVATHVQSAEKKGLKLTAEIDPELPLLSLDVMLLRRALNNLVDNAVKYTPNGGIVTVAAFTDDNAVLLSVRDTGLGISPENQGHLFERFRRVHRAEHQRVKGSGLGLFVVKNVAQRHNGDAWVESVEQVGSTFSIRIPIASANLPGIAGKSATDNDNR
jgi:PAS domain S-box-containing protein